MFLCQSHLTETDKLVLGYFLFHLCNLHVYGVQLFRLFTAYFALKKNYAFYRFHCLNDVFKQLPPSLRQPHSTADYFIFLSFITPSLFHSQLKTYLFSQIIPAIDSSTASCLLLVCLWALSCLNRLTFDLDFWHEGRP